MAGGESDADALFVLHQFDDAGQLGEGEALGCSLSGHQRVGDAMDAWYDPGSVKMGYDFSFMRYLYRPQPLCGLNQGVTP